MNNGTQAIDGTLRRPCTVGSITTRAVGEAPVTAPATVPVTVPSRKPQNMRMQVAAR